MKKISHLCFFLCILMVVNGNPQTANQLKLVINEIDYDQISTDTQEWLEIAGIINTSLTDILVVMINGFDNSIYNTFNLDTYSVPNSTAKVNGGDGNEWDFFVIGASGVTNVDLIPGTWTNNEIQNGAPDGVLLAYDSNDDGNFDQGTDVVIDAVAYESGAGASGFSTLFGTTRAPSDNNTDAASSIGRDGTTLDTDDNSVDFNYSGANGNTPGNLNTNQNASSLPVELSSFSASIINEGVRLDWKAETEVSNYGFYVERKNPPLNPLQGGDFETIGFVEGSGNSNSPKEYSFIDNNVSAGKYSYRLKQIDTDGKFEYSKVIEVDIGSPLKFELSQNYPNPFNPSTTIRFSLPVSTDVTITVYNLLGEKITALVNNFLEAGVHTVNFNAEGLNSGTYFYKIETADFNQVRKMTLIK